MNTPRISVVLPLYNGVDFVDETIRSVLLQDRDDFELLIIDDGSNDGSDVLARSWAERHPGTIFYLTHPDRKNHGLSATRNRGISQARGELVAFIDADDVWIEGKLDYQVDIMDRYPEIACVAGAAEYWSSWNGGTDVVKSAGSDLDAVTPRGQAVRTIYPLGNAQAPCPSALMVRADVLAQIGGFEESFTHAMQLYEDQAFLMKLYLDHAIYFSSRCHLRYRQHDASIVSHVKGAGQYLAVRNQFLGWFARYLRAHGDVPISIWAALFRARWRPYYRPILAALRRYKRALLPTRPSLG